MAKPSGFTYTRRKNGDIVISHHGTVATTLRGKRATRFEQQLVTRDQQEVMARATGNYKRGNERSSGS